MQTPAMEKINDIEIPRLQEKHVQKKICTESSLCFRMCTNGTISARIETRVTLFDLALILI